MKKKLINLSGLTGVISLISYALAVIFAPLAYPGYNWMAQAVSDLSAETAPSRLLWNQLAAAYNVCSPVCMMCVSIFVSDKKVSTKLFRLGIYLFAIMNWISAIGYRMFPLTDSGKEISTFQEKMHIVITIAVVLLSISSLTILIVAGFKKNGMKGIGIWASIALAMMLIGAIGKSAVSPDYFGIVERFSVFAAVGFNAVLGAYLFMDSKS
ncbi:Protein of unknown function [Butyrivibrio hungatei DSM 14810]|uniref:DUF998 domain-containing protein n=1 Tax=Butyrivibrio hungatei DSM 14810 TaxID=1121132 RepID=A0A1M7SFM8_9FIRM|nr:DUF998 domain-containing protein [Butyrivibrio hungatei]SHN57316.1 Protein of unknown function [Butyrivibrio hungatei DSM 14810]